MRATILCAVFPVVLFASASAQAHFKLQEPADWLVTNASGDPAGATGTQKMNPCGAGTPSGLITQVRAGSTLHIKLTETVPHGGHYRVALLPKYDPVSTDIPEPPVTLNAGSCDTAMVESPVMAPVLADGLFPHTQAQAVAGQVWETDVQIPNQLGNATLQVLEFMTPHPPQCFYHHCAQLEIVAADAGAGDGGVVVIGPDGGVVTPDAGGGSDGGGGGNDAGRASDASAGGGDAAGGGNPASPGADTGTSSGCSAGGSTAPSTLTLGVFVAAALSMVRRRRKS